MADTTLVAAAAPSLATAGLDATSSVKPTSSLPLPLAVAGVTTTTGPAGTKPTSTSTAVAAAAQKTGIVIDDAKKSKKRRKVGALGCYWFALRALLTLLL